MLIVGLTGSIGMGKSETAKMFARHGILVCDSDANVHTLYEKGGAAVEPVGAAFPGVVVDGRIDRELLSRQVVGKPEQMRKLESIVHPLVAASQRAFLEKSDASGAKIVVLDIPLLFETGGRARVDAIVVVSAPEDVQRRRVLDRPGMSAEKLDAILKKQLPDADKRAQADFVVDTSQGLAHAEAQVVAIIEALKTREAKVWKSNHA
jgi:dephospho-CoA kinase